MVIAGRPDFFIIKNGEILLIMAQSSKSVALINMPFGMCHAPTLGISLLKSVLNRKGIHCRNYYFNLSFAALIGFENYRLIADDTLFFSCCGEWLFSSSLFGHNAAVDEQYVKNVLLDDRRSWSIPPAAVFGLLRVRDRVDNFLERCLKEVDWSVYRVVGFSSSYQQHCASLALANRIKQDHPEVTIVFGGANCWGDTGNALLRIFPFIDYVCNGDGDIVFPILVERIISGSPVDEIPNIIGRMHLSSEKICAIPTFTSDLNSLPFPDFDDYFRQLEQLNQTEGLEAALSMETSRGCWWGENHRCRFCGVNAENMQYRRKSADRAIEEINYLKKHYRHKSRVIEFTDNILDYRYFKTLLPEMASYPSGMDLAWEVKANLTPYRIDILAAAGVKTIQPGIESLSDPILKLMNKGVNVLQNVQTLKWCKKLGLTVSWNLLYGIPYEDPAEYEKMEKLIPLLFHLSPPRICHHIAFVRFSEYWQNPGQYGITKLSPRSVYHYIYPTLEEKDLADMVCFFDAEYRDVSNVYAQGIVKATKQWQKRTDAALDLFQDGQSIYIADARLPGERSEHWFEGLKAELYLLCDVVRSITALRKALSVSGQACDEDIDAWIQDFVNSGLMMERNNQLLSLAVKRS